MKNPASAGRKQGSSYVVSLPARDYIEDSLTALHPQSLAVRRLASRFSLSASTAGLVAELAGLSL